MVNIANYLTTINYMERSIFSKSRGAKRSGNSATLKLNYASTSIQSLILNAITALIACFYRILFYALP